MEKQRNHGSSNNVERRRVQRLGASSLIITLPKKWANLLGIRVGDTVYLKLAKGHIKIIPSRYASPFKPLIIYINKDIPFEMARLAVSCLYILGIDEAVLDISDIPDKHDIIFSIKSIAQQLIGMDVIEVNGKLILKVFIDKKKIDINTIISNYKNILLFIIDLINDIITKNKIVDKELEIVRKDLVRYQHLLLRFIKDSVATPDTGDADACSISTGTYLGMAIDALIGAAHLFNEMLKKGVRLRPKIDYKSILNKSSYIIELMINNIINPNPEEILEMRKKSQDLFSELENIILQAKPDRGDLMFASALLQFTRIVNLYTNVVGCRFVEIRTKKEGEPWIFY